MKKTVISICIVLLTFSILMVGCSNKTNNSSISKASSGAENNSDTNTSQEPGTDTTGTMRTFTLEELKNYNGQDGNPAYVAVDGIVYDVSDIPQWNDGMHQGLTAGNDLTEAFSKSPHSKSVLNKLPIVGTLE